MWTTEGLEWFLSYITFLLARPRVLQDLNASIRAWTWAVSEKKWALIPGPPEYSLLLLLFCYFFYHHGFKICIQGTSLVVHWLRSCLPMLGKWVLSLIRELRSHMSGNYRACTLWSPCHRKESMCRNLRPDAVKNKTNKHLKISIQEGLKDSWIKTGGSSDLPFRKNWK